MSRALGLLEEAYASGDRGRAVRGNSFFHLALAEASGSRWIPRLLQPTLQTFERYGAAALTDETAAGVYAIESVGHVEILEACRAGDPEAAVAALARHRDTFVQIFETELAFGDHD